MWRQEQAGIVTRRQARDGGMTDVAIDARLASGRWQRLYTGVLATFSGPPSRDARLWAAVLATGPATMISHGTVAELWGLAEEEAKNHVCVPAIRRITAPAGVVVHRPRSFERARHPALSPPRTRVAATVLDLTDCSTDLQSALSWPIRAVASRLTTTDRLLASMETRSRLRWRRELTAALRDVADGCHSVLELRYARDVERLTAFPVAPANADGTGGGTTCPMWTSVSRPNSTAGWHTRTSARSATGVVTTLRYGYSDVAYQPCAVAREVAVVLRAAGWPGQTRPCGAHCPS